MSTLSTGTQVIDLRGLEGGDNNNWVLQGVFGIGSLDPSFFHNQSINQSDLEFVKHHLNKVIRGDSYE